MHAELSHGKQLFRTALPFVIDYWKSIDLTLSEQPNEKTEELDTIVLMPNHDPIHLTNETERDAFDVFSNIAAHYNMDATDFWTMLCHGIG